MAKQTILVVEDSPTTRAIFRSILLADGYAVVEAGSAVSALAVVGSHRPDLIIQDIVLPDADGFELTHRIRELPAAANVPIVVLSGFAGRLDEARAMANGYAGVLMKPVTPAALLKVVREQLPRSAPRERSGKGRHLLLVDDNPTQRKLDVLRFEEAGFRVTAAPGGKEAAAAVAALAPDIVVTDVLMPDMDGFELCEAIRSDAALTNVPVVLVSSHYDEEHDVALGLSVGASSFVLRSAGGHHLLDAVLDALEDGPTSSLLDSPLSRRPGERDRRVITQLNKRIARQADIDERSTQLTAEMSLLSGIAGALTHSADMEVTLRDIFRATLEAADISSGALFLRAADDTIALRYALGFRDESVADFFGCPSVLRGVVAGTLPVSIPSPTIDAEMAAQIIGRSGLTSLMLVPLVLEGRPVGILVLGAAEGKQQREGLAAFARAVGGQIVQSLALIEAFERAKAAETSLREANAELEAKVAARTRDLSEANAALAQTVQLRQDMIAIVSHDLRNPLNIISLTVGEMLRAVRLPRPVTERDIGRIERASNQMKQLITNLLDFSSIEEESFSVEKRPVKAQRMLEEAVEAYMPLAEAKAIRLEIVGPRSDGVVGGDSERLLYVFSNLIGNAIKFTERGGRISLSVATSDDGGCRFSVADTGKGIDPANLAHIFNRYWQERGSGGHGVGLGLAIAKGIVEAHGGRIWAESAQGEGATFQFILPAWASAT